MLVFLRLFLRVLEVTQDFKLEACIRAMAMARASWGPASAPRNLQGPVGSQGCAMSSVSDAALLRSLHRHGQSAGRVASFLLTPTAACLPDGPT